MNELVQKVVQQAGIPEETAQKAISAVVDFLKERMPGPLATQLESLLNGEGGGESGLTAAKSVLGMFERK
jgi:uncharacterized protein (DUF2267 family)